MGGSPKSGISFCITVEGARVQAKPTTLRALIKGEVQYVVPLYQRPYSWEQDQLERLWGDIVRQADILGGGGEAGHFLGSVVLAPGPALTPWNVQWVVVDGQQRLTTLFLMLCAIRDHRAVEDPGHRGLMNDLFLINKDQERDQRYRLLPTHLDRQSFQSCVEGVGEDADGNIGNAYRFFQKKLISVDDLVSCAVQHIESVLLDRLNLVQIAVDKGDSAFQIFESINNTGMRLGPVDFIRNYVFMCLPTRDAHVYDQHWKPLQRQLGVKGLDRLMHLVHVLSHGEKAEKFDVYRGHQELLEKARDDEDKVEQYVRGLARRGRYLARMLRPDEKNGIGSGIALLREFKAATTYPVIMRLLELRDEEEATDEEVTRALRYIESFVVRRLVGQVVNPSLKRVLHRLAVTLTPDRPVDETVLEELSPIRLGWSSDEEFRRDIAKKEFYLRGSQPQQKAVLRRLEESHSLKERIDLSVKEITIEHVLPRNPVQGWLDELAGEGSDPWLVHRRLVHTLGNLTLTAYNSELSNLPFEEKRKFFLRSAIAMNHGIAECERWGEAEILRRAGDLAERAIEIWPGPSKSSRAAVLPPDWSPLTRALAALPPMTWISYGDLAELIGSHVLPVRVYLDSTNVPNGHRVLTSDGEPPSEGRTVSRAELRQAMGTLQAEGIGVDELGRAHAAQRITTRELAVRLGMEGTESLGRSEPVPGEHQYIDDAQRRFLEQLGAGNGPQIAGAVQRLMEHWRAGGGKIRYGSAGTSCVLDIKRGDDLLTAIRIYPKKAEIPFDILMRRRPFDDMTVREGLRERFNAAPGVDIPSTLLERRPSFRVTALATESVWDVVAGCLDWFRGVVTREE